MPGVSCAIALSSFSRSLVKLASTLRCRESDDGDQVGLGHLLLHEFLGGIVRADQIVVCQRSQVEEQHDQAAVAQRSLIGVRGRRSARQYQPRRRSALSSSVVAVSIASMSS